VAFVIKHHIRFPGRTGEQATFFLKDPSDNHLEFKAFRNMDMLFAKDLERY
jgi:extradiol dioxygenase family protein